MNNQIVQICEKAGHWTKHLAGTENRIQLVEFHDGLLRKQLKWNIQASFTNIVGNFSALILFSFSSVKTVHMVITNIYLQTLKSQSWKHNKTLTTALTLSPEEGSKVCGSCISKELLWQLQKS